MRLRSGYQEEMQSSEDLTRAGVYTSTMAHSHGCWQEAFGPYLASISIGCLSVLMTSYLASLGTKDLKGNEQAGSCGTFRGLVFKVVHHHFHLILLIKMESLSPAFAQRAGNLFPIIEGKSINNLQTFKNQHVHPLATNNLYASHMQNTLIPAQVPQGIITSERI